MYGAIQSGNEVHFAYDEKKYPRLPTGFAKEELVSGDKPTILAHEILILHHAGYNIKNNGAAGISFLPPSVPCKLQFDDLFRKVAEDLEKGTEHCFSKISKLVKPGNIDLISQSAAQTQRQQGQSPTITTAVQKTPNFQPLDLSTQQSIPPPGTASSHPQSSQGRTFDQ